MCKATANESQGKQERGWALGVQREAWEAVAVGAGIGVEAQFGQRVPQLLHAKRQLKQCTVAQGQPCQVSQGTKVCSQAST